MCQQSISELGLEPCAFRRHNISAVSYIEQLLDTYGVKAEGNGHFPAINPFFKLGKPADTADKIYSFIRTLVANAEYRL